MRELKFRGIGIETGKWHYGNLITPDNLVGLIQNKRCPIIYHKNIKDLVDPETICQYTGIKDKNNVEIYEGDILQYKKSKRKFIVYWSKKYMMFCAGFLNEEIIPEFFRTLYNCETEIAEIIGNIYENSEFILGDKL